MSVGLRQSVIDMSQAVRAPTATCEMFKDYDAVLVKIEPALVSAATSTTEGVANFAKGLLAVGAGREAGYVATQHHGALQVALPTRAQAAYIGGLPNRGL